MGTFFIFAFALCIGGLVAHTISENGKRIEEKSKRRQAMSWRAVGIPEDVIQSIIYDKKK